MTSLKQKISKISKEIYPLIEQAHNAEIIFHENWNLEYPKLGQKYKETKLYTTTLDNAKKTLIAVQNVIKPAILALKNNDHDSLPTILAYLAAKNRHFGSGYNKEIILKLLRKIDFDLEQKEILQKIFFDQIELAGREFNEFVKLYPKIRDDKFDKKILELSVSGNKYVQKRLQSVTTN